MAPDTAGQCTDLLKNQKKKSKESNHRFLQLLLMRECPVGLCADKKKEERFSV